MRKTKWFLVVLLPSITGIGFALSQTNMPYNTKNTNNMLEANIEALTQSTDVNNHLYEKKDEKSMEILDDATGTYQKMVVIICEGTGNLVCP